MGKGISDFSDILYEELRNWRYLKPSRLKILRYLKDHTPTVQEISNYLQISEKTVYSHMKLLQEKLLVKKRKVTERIRRDYSRRSILILRRKPEVYELTQEGMKIEQAYERAGSENLSSILINLLF